MGEECTSWWNNEYKDQIINHKKQEQKAALRNKREKKKKKKKGSRTCSLPGWSSLDTEQAAWCPVCLPQFPRNPHRLRTESLTTACAMLHPSSTLNTVTVYQLWLHTNSKYFPSIRQVDLSFRSSETKNRWCILYIVCNYFLPSVRMSSFSIFIESAQKRDTWLNYEFHLSSCSSKLFPQLFQDGSFLLLFSLYVLFKFLYEFSLIYWQLPWK